MLKKSFSVFLFAFLIFGLSACHDDKNDLVIDPEVPELPDIPEWEEPDYASVKCEVPIFVSDGILPEVRNGMEQFLTNITSLEEAEVAVVKPEDIGTYEGKLMDVFNRGGLIVVARPTGNLYQEFAKKYQIFDTMPFDASQSVLIFATDQTRTSYTLYADGPKDGADEATYYKQRIFNFFRWLKHLREAETTTRAVTLTDIKQGRVAYDEGQHIVQNFEVQMNNEVYKDGSKSQSLKASGSIDVSYHVYPVYAFEEEGTAAGDYYLVETEVTAHNEDFYRPYVTNDVLNKMVVSGYYMKHLGLNAQLVDEYGDELSGITFDSDYQPSPVPTIQNLTVEKYQSPMGDVDFLNTVENFNFEGSPASMDYLDEAIPEVARNDVRTQASWCWMIPAQTNGVGDCAKVHFNIKSELYLQYGSFIYKLLGASTQSDWDYAGISSTISITPPERRPLEVIEKENKQVMLTWPALTIWEFGGDPMRLTTPADEDGLIGGWEVGDEIYVEYTAASGGHMKTTAKVLDIDPITMESSVMVELAEIPKEKDLVAFYYPYTYLDECVGWDPQLTVKKSQLGTIDDLFEHWVAMLGFDHPKVVDGKVTLPNGIKMEPERAIWELSFTDGYRDITPDVTQLDITCDNGKGKVYTYTINPEASLETFYVAINNGEVAGVTLTAHTPNGTFTVSSPSVKFEAGKKYSTLNVLLSPPEDGGPINLAYKRIYEAQDGDVLTGKAHESAHITVAAGATITLQDAEVTGLLNDLSQRWAGITCLGDATIIIEGENKVSPAYEVHPAIYVPVGSTLTIKGSGKLQATSRNGNFGEAAAIGGGNGIPCGNIVIEGGTIEAIAKGNGGAGIGGGGANGYCGTITIAGGNVKAVAATRAAGIGCGFGSSCGDITISGGEVDATGGLAGSGIGASFGVPMGNITISGGKVKAVGGDSSPGIGYRAQGGLILITGGEVEATGDGSAAAIGGSSGLADYPCEFEGITITDGATRITTIKGSDSPRYIGMGKVYYECGPIIVDGIEDPMPYDRFPHFASITEGVVWTLLNHNR